MTTTPSPKRQDSVQVLREDLQSLFRFIPDQYPALCQRVRKALATESAAIPPAGYARCPECDGRGSKNDQCGNGRYFCTYCGGTGRLAAPQEVKAEPRNFCPVCGKCTPPGSIHTCTPPAATSVTSAQPDACTKAPVPIDQQMARWAIDGAILKGRTGEAGPPTADHWLHEYWCIGQQLAKLGETSPWDNVTPISTAPVPAPESVTCAPSKITWPEVSAAANAANQSFGQWMPERWVQAFVKAYNKE